MTPHARTTSRPGLRPFPPTVHSPSELRDILDAASAFCKGEPPAAILTATERHELGDRAGDPAAVGALLLQALVAIVGRYQDPASYDGAALSLIGYCLPAPRGMTTVREARTGNCADSHPFLTPERNRTAVAAFQSAFAPVWAAHPACTAAHAAELGRVAIWRAESEPAWGELTDQLLLAPAVTRETVAEWMASMDHGRFTTRWLSGAWLAEVAPERARWVLELAGPVALRSPASVLELVLSEPAQRRALILEAAATAPAAVLHRLGQHPPLARVLSPSDVEPLIQAARPRDQELVFRILAEVGRAPAVASGSVQPAEVTPGVGAPRPVR